MALLLRVRPMVLCVGCVLCLAAMPLQAEVDIAGARDPADIARYPRSWIVDYVLEQDGAPREFVVNRVDRIRRDLRIQDLRRVNADLEAATYQVPAGTRLEEIVAHYRSSIGGEVLFSCSGRDCGRSNDWANQVFRRAILYGPDSNQHYLALQRGDQLLAVYVVERGNKRIYAHLQVLTTVDGVAPASGDVLQLLTEQGWILIADLKPLPDGQLPENAAAALAAIAGDLEVLTGRLLYVVCHLTSVDSPGVDSPGVDSPGLLVDSSQQCADQAVSVLKTQLTATGPQLRGFGAGPLAPRRATPGSRLEIVDPSHRSVR